MALCCAVCETASCACTLGKCLCAGSKLSTKCANVVYLFILIAMTLIAFILQEWGAPQFNFYSFNVGCNDIPGIDVVACKGENAVYRISMGMALWFLLLALGNMCSSKFHTGIWGLKIGLLLGMVSGFFFIPITGQDGYVPFARTVSAVFLVSQIVSFIDAAYHWNAFFVGKAHNNGGKWITAILAICFAIIVGVVACFVLLYLKYNFGNIEKKKLHCLD